MRTASFLSRFGAILIDGIVVALIFIPVYFVLFLVGVASLSSDASTSGSGFAAVMLFSMAVSILIQFVYYGITMARPGYRNGQTLGKQALGVRVVNRDGSSFSWGNAFKREFLIKSVLVYVLSAITFGVFAILNYLWPLWDDKGQALHDKMAGTFVVEADRAPGALDSAKVGFVPPSADPMHARVPADAGRDPFGR